MLSPLLSIAVLVGFAAAATNATTLRSKLGLEEGAQIFSVSSAELCKLAARVYAIEEVVCVCGVGYSTRTQHTAHDTPHTAHSTLAH